MLVNFESLPVAAGMRPGSTRVAIAGDRISAVKVTTTADALFDGSLHRHANEQILVVIEGSVDIECDAEQYTVKARELAFFPSGSLHGAVGVGPEGAVYYELFAPPRHDQLPGFLGASPLVRE